VHVLTVLARDPDARLRDVAEQVQITERAVHRIITELVDEGYLTRERVGARNSYVIHREKPLRHPVHAGRTLGDVLDALALPAA
jgi:predicted transcriptional regulator